MRVFWAIILSFFTALCAYGEAINGGVEKRDIKTGRESQILDAHTGSAVPYANVTIPQKQYRTKTDEDGKFELGTKINAPTIMSVQKEGYKPYSLTLNSESNGKPIIVGIEKTTPKDVIIETDMIHLGDDSYSENSANAGEFAVRSSGPFYSKDFNIKFINNEENAYLRLGSVIGIDSLMARELGQTKVTTAYANPPQVFCNGNKIAEIKINGDGQEIRIPRSVVRQGQMNDITIKAGKNMMQTTYVDYDDIEFTNLLIEIK